MRLTASIIASRTMIAGDTIRKPCIDERIQRLVYCGQTDVGHTAAHDGEHLLSRRMVVRSAQANKHRLALSCVTPAGLLQSVANVRVLHRTAHRFAVKHAHIVHFRLTERARQETRSNAPASELPLENKGLCQRHVGWAESSRPTL